MDIVSRKKKIRNESTLAQNPFPQSQFALQQRKQIETSLRNGLRWAWSRVMLWPVAVHIISSTEFKWIHNFCVCFGFCRFIFILFFILLHAAVPCTYLYIHSCNNEPKNNSMMVFICLDFVYSLFGAECSHNAALQNKYRRLRRRLRRRRRAPRHNDDNNVFKRL